MIISLIEIFFAKIYHHSFSRLQSKTLADTRRAPDCTLDPHLFASPHSLSPNTLRNQTNHAFVEPLPTKRQPPPVFLISTKNEMLLEGLSKSPGAITAAPETAVPIGPVSQVPAGPGASAVAGKEESSDQCVVQKMLRKNVNQSESQQSSENEHSVQSGGDEGRRVRPRLDRHPDPLAGACAPARSSGSSSSISTDANSLLSLFGGGTVNTVASGKKVDLRAAPAQSNGPLAGTNTGNEKTATSEMQKVVSHLTAVSGKSPTSNAHFGTSVPSSHAPTLAPSLASAAVAQGGNPAATAAAAFQAATLQAMLAASSYGGGRDQSIPTFPPSTNVQFGAAGAGTAAAAAAAGAEAGAAAAAAAVAAAGAGAGAGAGPGAAAGHMQAQTLLAALVRMQQHHNNQAAAAAAAAALIPAAGGATWAAQNPLLPANFRTTQFTQNPYAAVSDKTIRIYRPFHTLHAHVNTASVGGPPRQPDVGGASASQY